MGEFKNNTKKNDLPKSCHEAARETQTNIITIIDTLYVITLSRRPTFIRIGLRKFLDWPNFIALALV
jgi:hypothetical protein